jgi:predicted oxidoreductase
MARPPNEAGNTAQLPAMQTTRFGKSSLTSSRLSYGCWRLAGTWNPREVTPETEAAGRRALCAAVEAGYTTFDHADIYCRGACERIFGQVLRENPGWRERMVIVTKCGIRSPDDPPGAPYRYDFSSQHIVSSCEASLQRLNIDTIDVFLLHRPDYLMDPEEVAAAFTRLRASGKVREFGVSNFRPFQVTALGRAYERPLVVNQVEMSLAHLDPLEDGTLDQCLTEGITPMAWSPLAGGRLGDGSRRVLPSQEAYQTAEINRQLDAMAANLGASRTAVALAWLLRHPAGIVPVVGSVDPTRIREAVKADTLRLSREDWYQLLTVARGCRLP